MSRDYYDKGGISTYDFIKAKGLNFAEGCIVKYVTRWRVKDGVADLHKAKWYLESLIKEAELVKETPESFNIGFKESCPNGYR